MDTNKEKEGLRRPSKEKSTESDDSESQKAKVANIISQNPNILQITNLYFKQSDSQKSQVKPTVRCTDLIDPNILIRDIICKEWILNQPQIVVFIISNVGPVHTWTNPKQIKSFQKGLMKAVESTNMWLITNGLDVGATTIIGDAVTNFMTEAKYKRQASADKTYAKFNFIGIVDQKLVKNLKTITDSDRLKIEISPDQSTTVDENLYELNQNLSHYILVEEKTSGINYFLQNLTYYLYEHQKSDESVSITPMSSSSRGSSVIRSRKSKGPSNKGPADEEVAKQKEMARQMDDDKRAQSLHKYIQTNEVPVVYIVIKGGFGCSKLVLSQVERHVPVVVLKGSGGLADLLAFVDIEIRDRSLSSWDVEFVETYIKPELAIKIMETFPELRNNSILCNQFRQTVLNIVRESQDTKTGQNYLTVINMLDMNSCDLENLTEQLLYALFQSQRAGPITNVLKDQKSDTQVKPSPTPLAGPKSEDTIIKDLRLCIDWNCPDMARREVLAKHPNFSLNSKEGRQLFELSLIRQNRWKFIDLFMSQKFKLRNFVPKRLRKLFRVIHFNKFYVNICWEGILRQSKAEIMEFIQKSSSLDPQWSIYFNELVKGCTGIKDFVDTDELGRFVTEQWHPSSEREAERKSLEQLVFWCLFDNRRELVRTFWQHSDQPIQLAIVIAIAYDRLSWYVIEETLINRLKEESNLFVSFAFELLDIVYKDSPYRAEEVLNESTKDWNFKTPVDMAAIGNFRLFFSHESVQRWLTAMMNGSIEIRKTKYGLFKLPDMIKLISSAYLVLPIYFWIKPLKFESDFDKNQERLLLEEEETENDIVQNVKPEQKGQPSIISGQGTIGLNAKSKSNLEERQKNKFNEFKNKIMLTSDNGHSIFSLVWWVTAIYEVWTAPITKFWNYQFFYTFYLALFSLATLYPMCGHFYMDIIISFWTTMIIVDNTRQTYLTSRRYSKYSLVSRIVQIGYQIFFVLYLLRWRIYENSQSPDDAFKVKVVMCIALIQAYYVLLTVFLPISATLGPLLYRLKIMIFLDFLNFIRLSILVMISFGIVVQALFYPDADVNGPLFRQMFSRTFFSLFITPKDELDGHENPSYKHCQNQTWTQPEIDNLTKYEEFCSASLYSNPQCPNTGFWVYIFFIAYLVLIKLLLLTVLYAIFASSATRLTADTDSIWKFQRYGLVMDFVVRSPLPPPLNLFYYIYWIIRFLCAIIVDMCCKKEKEFLSFIKILRLLYYGPEPQQKTLADDDYAYLRILGSEVFERYENKMDSESMSAQHFERTKMNSQELENQRKHLRRLRSEMCEMKRSIRLSHTSMETIKHLCDKKTGLETIGSKSLHILSRHSPYPNTNVHRYPVPDKYVSWEVMFIEYEPAAYTKPADEFSTDIRQFVDTDILAKKVQEVSGKPVIESKFEWNRLSGTVETIDRRSWDGSEKEPVIYKLKEGLPVNPCGRTGLIGRGALLRWGPNHYLMVVITRIRETDKKPALDVLVEKSGSKKDSVSLINRFIPGEMTYKSIEALFKITDEELMGWTDQETTDKLEKTDKSNQVTELKMVRFFKSMDVPDSKTDSVNEQSLASSLKYERMMRGYFDDPLNTDHAWKEIELWHFHFTKDIDALDQHITDLLEWREVKETLFYSLTMSQSQVIQTIVDKLNIDIL